jgi:NDP-sugar pyrophosphorylase family protein
MGLFFPAQSPTLDPVQAMVLAAGFGTRLRPLTSDRAKPAVPFLGRPLVRRLVEQLAAQGFERIVVNLHHQPGSVRAALTGLPVRYSEESTILGTAGGIGLAVAAGMLSARQPLLVVNGKLFTDVAFDRLLQEHRSAAAATMLLLHNRNREAFREVFVDGNRIRGFGTGRQPEGANPLAFTGIQVLGPDILRTLTPSESDTVRDVFPSWIDRGRIDAAITERRWWEFSTPERYLGLHLRAWAEGLAPTPAHQSVVWDGAHIDPSTQLHRCIVLDRVKLPGGQHTHRILSARDDGSMLITPLDPASIAHAAAD